MLVTGNEILKKAHKEYYGVGAFNFVNYEMLSAIFEAANEANSPIIVQASEGAIKYLGIDMAVGMVKILSKKYPHIPVALHLDHGTTFESCKAAVDAGFTSVMIDASHHPFEENLSETSKVVKMAHAKGVSVEAELGRLMGIEDNISVSEKDAVLVNPKEAEQFVKESGVDFLAPAIGTSHGAFKFKGEPKLDFERLQEVKRLTNIPLVLHGASAIPDYVKDSFLSSGGDLKGSKGVPFSFLQESIKGGINKVNTDTDLRIAFIAEVRKVANDDNTQFDLRKFFTPGKEAIKKLIIERMNILGSSNKI
ncbi:class II fructose-bisphosphate aldolase [Helicobacter sp. MIT 99-5507]|uniref:class II fructose-bisphosphate aldolase n=1 Tax=Helicobacter sp. MIT 99-5507 TaxID=152489 RepID=UPI000E1F712D|nr:class II fructose-bisphosphate aldolase [Helicobacter sp. MIT 99-5507]RDU56739.1 fructose-1,6-bisphosphate aldolase, class II [Helicobacter sp. MIT 99-5507]